MSIINTARVLTPWLSLLLIASSPFSHADGETLLDIYELAKQNDHQLKSDHAEYLAGIEVATINRAALLPQITGTAASSYTNADTRGTTPQETNTNEFNYGVSLTQAIVDFSAWNTYKQGKVEEKLALVNYQASQQSLIIRSAEAYFNALRAKDQLQTAYAEQKAQATLLEQTKQRYDVGLISINDVHETQAAYDSSVATAINAEANLGIQYDSLTVLTGQFHTEITPLRKNFNAINPTPNKQQDWVEFAIKNNYTLKASELTADASRLNAKAVSADHLPTVDGTISYTDRDRDIDTEGVSTSDTDTNTAVFSLNLEIPLYRGGGLSALERQAEHNAVSAWENYLFTRRTVTQETRSLFLSVTSDIPQIKARRQAIISNESALEATKAGYDAGTRDIVDIVNAQRNLFQAQRDYFDSLYNYIINTLSLKEATGTLQVADLELLEQSLDK